MSISLNATLAAAQNEQSRHPLVKITSSQRSADIPFDGSLLTTSSYNEYESNLIAYSTGRMCIAYVYGPDSSNACGILYTYTDIDRLEFTTVTIQLYAYNTYTMVGVSLCEMSDGNICLIALVNDTGNHVYRLLRRVITVTGTAVSNAEIANWSHDTFTSSPWVQTIGTNSYLLVYGKKSGSNYYIYKRTSSDCITWSAESALSIAGLTATYRLNNPSIVKLSTGDLWLFFDVLEATGTGSEELTNIYYSVSSDNGVTWGTAVKVTNYTTFSEVGSHPVAIQKIANTLTLVYTKVVGALHMNESTSGWPTGDDSYNLSWDSVNRKLYVINYNGASHFTCIVRIDTDTWLCDKYWDTTTTPAFGSWTTAETISSGINDGHIIVLFSTDNSKRFISVLDGEADSITNYYLDTSTTYGVTKNVDGAPSLHFTGSGGDTYGIVAAYVDATNNRIYLLFSCDYVYERGIYIGYIDLTETSNYEIHEVVTYQQFDSEWELSNRINFYVDTVNNYIVVTTGNDSIAHSDACGTRVYNLTDGSEVARWRYPTNTDFPYYGLTSPFIYNKKIYAGLYIYTTSYSQSTLRGLVEIDIVSKIIKYHRPSYCSDDNHLLGRPFYLQDGKIAMVHVGYGVAVYDTISDTWELFSNTNIAGFTTDGVELSEESQIQFDDTNDLIMVGDANSKGIIMFSIHGYMRQSYYSEGSYSGGVWSFATANQLVAGYLDYNAGVCLEPGSETSFFVFWTSEDTDGEKSVKWDKEGTSTNISDYLVDEISTQHDVSGNPAKLNFSISHGHLFDPTNQLSLLSPILKKGRKLSLQWGELVNGTEYWQAAGEFFVTSTSLDFELGQYPVMRVEAEDQRCLWAHGHVYATAIYNNLAEDIIEDLLLDIANIAVANQNLPIFNGTSLSMQWIETTLDEIITQICERYGYYFRFDVDGNANAKPIRTNNSVDHAYTDSTKLLKYSPDDTYSDYTNRVTVRGQELSYTEVMFAEEQITNMSGTIGWWGCKADHKIWYSEDHSRRVMYPRLEVLETSVSIPMQLAGSVEEWLEECLAADDYKFCTVYVEAPNLIPLLVALAASVIGGMYLMDAVVVVGFVASSGYTIRIGTAICQFLLYCITMILGSMANYAFAVWGRPLGLIRRSVQDTWNDTIHQSEINAIVEQVIDDPLCYSSADCLEVATYEGTIAKLQRNRVVFSKVAHIQDEDGDTLSLPHPYSDEIITIFVASLTRRYKKPSINNEDGYFTDEIEGWIL